MLCKVIVFVIATVQLCYGDSLVECETRDRYYAYNHVCFISCESDGYCPDGGECLCDGRCGMSCIYHDKTEYCEAVVFPENGFAILKTIGHGDVIISHGAQLDFHCNFGYAVVGETLLTCMVSGAWDNPPPTCVDLSCVETCGDPPSLENGMVTVCEECEGVNVVSFTCNSGYFLIGNSSVTCNHGVWSRLEAVCLKECCRLSNIPEQALIEFNDMCSEVVVVNFTCSEGYTLVGENVISCQRSELAWSSNPPMCVARECDELQLGENLNVSQRSRAVGVQITFSCREGHRLIGPVQSECFPNSSWSNEVPQCEAITCIKPELRVRNIFISPVKNVYLYGEKINYACRSRFHSVEGNTTRTCLQTGKFSGKKPSCHARCKRYKVNFLKNGVIVRSSVQYYLHGGWIQVYCHSTFRLVGASYFECSNGHWSSNLNPSCVKDLSNYARFPTVVHGHTTINGVVDVTQGSSVTVDCMFLSRSRRPWWILDPRGAKKQIPGTLQPNANVYRMELTDINEEDAGTYVCLSPFDSNRGKVEIQVIATCGDPGTPENGFRRGDDFTVGRIVVFACESGTVRIPSGRSIIRCTYLNGAAQWTAEAPICYKETCRNTVFPAPDNGATITTFPNDGDDYAIQTFSCNTGYKLNNNEHSQVTCENAVWEGTVPQCITTCTGMTLPSPANGISSMSIPDLEVDSSIQTFTCDIGYQLEPPNNRTATCINGEWNMDLPPICSEKLYQFTINSNEMFEGRELFVVEGDTVNVDCEVQGTSVTPTWTKLVNEKPLIVNENSFRNQMFFPSIGVSNSGTYYCTDGQNHEYINISVMPLNELCSVDLNLPNGHVTGIRATGKYFIGYERSFNCGTGYTLHGDQTCTCESEGWNCQLPTCIQDHTLELKTPSVERLNQSIVVVYSGSDVVIDCLADDDITETLFESGVVHWYRVMQNQLRMMDGFNEFIIEDGQYLRLAILNIQSGSQGWYTCASPIISKSVFIQVNIPCSIIQPPSNGFLQGSNWRTGATVTCECGENYVLNGSAIRHCLPNGEWTGEECSCVVLGCDKFKGFGNGTVEIEGEHLIGGLLRFTCAPDFRLVGESVLECAKSGMWNGSLPKCEDICANNACTDDKKCVVRQREATCICKTSDDCPIIEELVCGSDAVTYSNECLLKVTACSTEKVIDVMHHGRCTNGVTCHANPVHSDVQCVNQIYFRSDIKACVQVADGFCMQSDEGFRTVDECEDQCMGDYDETCSQAVDSGFGPYSYLRFYYDQQESKCMSFEYYGAGGNHNNFKSRDECIKTCPDMCGNCETVMSLLIACRLNLEALIVEVVDVRREVSGTQFGIHLLKKLGSDTSFNGTNINSHLYYHEDPCTCPHVLPLSLPYLLIPTLYIDHQPILDSGTYAAEFDVVLKDEIQNLIDSNVDCRKYFADIESELYRIGSNYTGVQ